MSYNSKSHHWIAQTQSDLSHHWPHVVIQVLSQMWLSYILMSESEYILWVTRQKNIHSPEWKTDWKARVCKSLGRGVWLSLVKRLITAWNFSIFSPDQTIFFVTRLCQVVLYVFQTLIFFLTHKKQSQSSRLVNLRTQVRHLIISRGTIWFNQD